MIHPDQPDETSRRTVPPIASGGLPVLNPDEFEVDDEDEGEDEVDDGPRTILITGASGNIGRKLREAWDDVYDLVLIDQEPDPDEPSLIVADLSVLDEAWMEAFHGVDAVVHLAGNPDEFAAWEDLVGPNIDATNNVFHAAALAGIERIVFASSNHAMGGYRELGDMPITVDLPPKPDGPYGGTKLMGERLGVGLAGIFEMTFVALRLGWVQVGDNRPDTLPDEWSRSLWLSNGDMVRLFTRAIEADLGDRSSTVVNGMSNNQGTRWDLASSAESIGFWPTDDAFADEAEHPGPRSLG
ncbi:NAD-dependent epimerase/dehydratase family protein [Tundrisphaera sp. TA3]|uniref:NAD-dependent epimerase/dehydratase family protein n=1 Tax=Tundrisphaera sp. TA3 TaxID=3435775 RepID=UPI003EC10046